MTYDINQAEQLVLKTGFGNQPYRSSEKWPVLTFISRSQLLQYLPRANAWFSPDHNMLFFSFAGDEAVYEATKIFHPEEPTVELFHLQRLEI